jgi:zinc D-Ala-D-Ala carboxypeptidase
MASKGEGELLIDEASMDKLQKLRSILGKPLIVSSAYRSLAHNRKVGSMDTSQHRKGKAFDVVMANHDPAHFESMAKAVGFAGIGHYPNASKPFMHINTGPARRWNDGRWFPANSAATPNFQLEPKRETIVDIVTKPEVLTGAGGVLTGAGAISQGSGPVQFALGVALVIVVCAFAAWLVMKAIQRPRDV